METHFDYHKDSKRSVLIVDDEFVNRQLLGYILREEYEVLHAENGQQALDIIKEHKKDLSIVLLDILMPVMNGFELLEIMRGDPELKRIPVIVLTSEASAEVQSLKLGAADFIKKPYDMPEVILARVKRIIELSEDKFIIQSAEKDLLTGLYTKEFFYEYSTLMEQFHPDIEMDAVAVNIDHFHLINELYGREYGDKILKHIAESISTQLEKVDGIGCRHEADMFYIYCVHQDNIEEMLNNIINSLTELSNTPNTRLRIGVYLNVERDLPMDSKFDRAKIACNMIRNNYTKHISYYDSKLHDKDIFAQRLVHDMHEALENKNFKVYYQPKYAIANEKPVLKSAEALIRWNHPELGMISPGAFIPLFEENGLIQHLDHYVWREVGKQIRIWKDKFGVTIPVSVNVSRIDIYDPHIEEMLMDILTENHLNMKDYMLEITESAYAEDANYMINVVEKLRSHGFKIEMDDFGSGYSSLNMLTELPIDVLKLDMKFIKNIHKEKNSLRMIELIMDIAKHLHVPVIAEGVEMEEQYKLLKETGCDVIQGYYFSKPVPPEEFEKIIEENIARGTVIRDTEESEETAE